MKHLNGLSLKMRVYLNDLYMNGLRVTPTECKIYKYREFLDKINYSITSKPFNYGNAKEEDVQQVRP